MCDDVYVWKDIVEINGEIYCEEAEIDGSIDDDNNYILDDFYRAVADKYDVDEDDIKTFMMDDIEIDPSTLPYGGESCGCYINGVPEWHVY